jgi:hypothetical protein
MHHCILKGQLARVDLFDVASESILVPLGNAHHAEDFRLALFVSQHLGERLAVALDQPEVFVQPDDDVPVVATVSEALEPLEGVPDGLSARHHRVNAQSPAGGAEQFEYVVLHDVAPERNEIMK